MPFKLCSRVSSKTTRSSWISSTDKKHSWTIQQETKSRGYKSRWQDEVFLLRHLHEGNRNAVSCMEGTFRGEQPVIWIDRNIDQMQTSFRTPHVFQVILWIENQSTGKRYEDTSQHTCRQSCRYNWIRHRTRTFDGIKFLVDATDTVLSITQPIPLNGQGPTPGKIRSYSLLFWCLWSCGSSGIHFIHPLFPWTDLALQVFLEVHTSQMIPLNGRSQVATPSIFELLRTPLD